MKVVCMWRVVTIVFLMAQVGCDRTYKDISDRIEYRDIIGKEYTTLVPLTLEGISRKNGKESPVAFYTARKPFIVNHVAPEVVDTKVLAQGAILRVLKAVKYPVFLGSVKAISVELVSGGESINRPIFLYWQFFEKSNMTGKVELNELYFK